MRQIAALKIMMVGFGSVCGIVLLISCAGGEGDKSQPVGKGGSWSPWNLFEPGTTLPGSGLIGPVTIKTDRELTF